MGVPLIDVGGFVIELPKNPIGSLGNDAVNWLTENLPWFFGGITWILNTMAETTLAILEAIPPEIFTIIVALIIWRTVGLKMVPIGAFFILLIWNMGIWEEMIESVSLMIVALIIAWVIGIPLGIWKAHSKIVNKLLTPVLDTMQTTPPMTYLIPAILFFGIGTAPSIVSIVIFTIAPPIRTTSLGIEEIPGEVIEAGKSFGASTRQIVTKIEFPIAKPAILVGMNQSIMIGFTMVVLAGFIGAGGLGEEIIGGINRGLVGRALEAGISVVFLAIILDRVLRNIGSRGPGT